MNQTLFQAAAIFSDGAVLQRDKRIAVFGTAPSGMLVRVAVKGNNLDGEFQVGVGEATAKDNRFLVYVGPLKAGLDHIMTIEGIVVNDMEEEHGESSKQDLPVPATIVFNHIAIGEVWLAGGQSNMEFELCNCAEKDELNKPANPMIRFYYTQKKAIMDEAFYESERKTHWESFGDEGTLHWSAVGYFFGKKLLEELNVPVGIIGCNWGGTSASSWVPRKVLEEDRELQVYLDIYDKAVEGRSLEQQKREYEEYEVYQEAFYKGMEECYKEDPNMDWDEVQRRIGPDLYPGPMGYTHPYRPNALYACLLQRVMPYSLKGFIYYQGESDEHLPRLYYKLFSKLIGQWREDWKDDTLPFIFAQLPMNRYIHDPDFKNWPLIREAQQRVNDTVQNALMTNIIDQGAYQNIHPTQKKVVGERMCAQALKVAYGYAEADEAEYPVLKDYAIFGNQMILTFTNVKDGLIVRLTKQPYRPGYEEEKLPVESRGFEVAGEDGVYYPADVIIEKDRIVLSSESVERPAFARYLWTNYSDVYIFNSSEQPLAPFRTSREDGFEPLQQIAKIQQKMVTSEK